jgi:hypothetical protein
MKQSLLRRVYALEQTEQKTEVFWNVRILACDGSRPPEYIIKDGRLLRDRLTAYDKPHVGY